MNIPRPNQRNKHGGGEGGGPYQKNASQGKPFKSVTQELTVNTQRLQWGSAKGVRAVSFKENHRKKLQGSLGGTGPQQAKKKKNQIIKKKKKPEQIKLV